MGAHISLPLKPSPSSASPSSPPSPLTKKNHKPASPTSSKNPPLIPSLPDEISIQILARLPRHTFLPLKLVSRSWNHALVSRELFGIRKDLGLAEEWLYMLVRDEEGDSLSWHAVDPVSGKWQRLPALPDVNALEEREDEEGEEEEDVVAEGSSKSNHNHSDGCSRDGRGRRGGYGWWGFSAVVWMVELVKGLLEWKGGEMGASSVLSGCAAGAWEGYLFVLGGFSRGRAIADVWRYDPRANEWQGAAPMSTPRAHCKTAILNGKLYALGGVDKTSGAGNSSSSNPTTGGGLVPLQSAEVYDPTSDLWCPIPSMPFSNAHAQAQALALPSPISDHTLKPIATSIASFRGKLCVPQSLYSWPFFVDAGGEIFDPSSNSWAEMPKGMGEDWPAKQAGTKLSVVVNDSLYALDPTSSSLDGSKIKVYDEEADAWKIVLAKVPIILDFSDSESPYLLAGFKTRLHVVTKDINDCIVVLRAEATNNVSSSPRMSETESWKIVARKKFGAVELVACQVLEI